MANKTISIPDDLIPVIDTLGLPFSNWVATQLRHHAASQDGSTFAEQLLADAALVNDVARPTVEESKAALERMERSAPW